jgi:hypothetical protein
MRLILHKDDKERGGSVLGAFGFGTFFASGPLTATLPGLAWMNLPEFPSVSSGFDPAQVLGGYPAAPSMFRSGSPLSLIFSRGLSHA